MFEEQLQRLGLTDGEAKVYEALVGLGPSTVGPIVKRSGVAYSNVYDVLQRLLEKGLMSYSIKEKTRHWNAAPPERLNDFLDRQEQKITENRALLANLLPSLSPLDSRATDRLEAEVFIGKRGIMTAYDRLYERLPVGATIKYLYAHDASYYEQAFAFYRQLWPELVRRKFTGRGIAERAYKQTKMSKGSPTTFDERYVDFPVPANIDITDDCVLIVTWSGTPIGILIHSTEVARNFDRYFDATWKIAKK